MASSLRADLGDMLKSKVSALGAALTDANSRYQKEMIERKKLHNMVQELKGNIRVFLRCRPPSDRELEQGGNDPVCVKFPSENEVLVLNEKGN